MTGFKEESADVPPDNYSVKACVIEFDIFWELFYKVIVHGWFSCLGLVMGTQSIKDYSWTINQNSKCLVKRRWAMLRSNPSRDSQMGYDGTPSGRAFGSSRLTHVPEFLLCLKKPIRLIEYLIKMGARVKNWKWFLYLNVTLTRLFWQVSELQFVNIFDPRKPSILSITWIEASNLLAPDQKKGGDN